MAEQLYTRRSDGSYQPVVLHRVIDCDAKSVVRRAWVYHRPARADEVAVKTAAAGAKGGPAAEPITEPAADPLAAAGFPWLVQLWLAGEWQTWMGFCDSRFAFRLGEEQHRRDRKSRVRIVGPEGYELVYEPDRDAPELQRGNDEKVSGSKTTDELPIPQLGV